MMSPAEIFYPSEFIKDEMKARGWSMEYLASLMSGDFQENCLAFKATIDEISRLREELASAKQAAAAYEAWKFPENIQTLTVENERLREENARLRSILAAKVRPPFDDDLAGEPYATKDRQPEPGGLG